MGTVRRADVIQINDQWSWWLRWKRMSRCGGKTKMEDEALPFVENFFLAR
jgi:hypothetical protein